MTVPLLLKTRVLVLVVSNCESKQNTNLKTVKMDRFVKKLDFYRRVPKDLTETSVLGASISVVTM